MGIKPSVNKPASTHPWRRLIRSEVAEAKARKLVQTCDRCNAVAATVVACGDCGKEYKRCIGCGFDSARRSLRSHRGLFHPSGAEGSGYEDP